MSLYHFLYPSHRYRGPNKPEYIAFDSRLQEFAYKVNTIAALQTNGKLSSLESYQEVKKCWKQLKKAKHSFLE